MKLVRIENPKFVAGVVVGRDNRVRHVPPIVGYMRQWSLQQVVAYSKGKGWSVLIEETPASWEAL